MRKGTIQKHEFEQLFREQYPRLYRFTLQFTTDEEEAKDIVADCFWTAWKNREGIEKDKLTGYLFVCARNKSLSLLEKSRHISHIDGKDSNTTFAAETEGQWIEKETMLQEMEDAISTLTPRTRLILQKHYLERLSYKEVAEQLDISTSGVKKHIVKALSVLRARLGRTE